jgi:hypothetical protein
MVYPHQKKEAPMSKGTPLRNLRVDDDLWEAATAKAQAEHREGGVSEVIRELLTRWVTRPPRKRKRNR